MGIYCISVRSGFTQEPLTNELGLEISQIRKTERGVINTSFTIFYSISKVLNVDVSGFFVSDFIVI
jgi:transcriptional regulator with XRE-family HTH domain